MDLLPGREEKGLLVSEISEKKKAGAGGAPVTEMLLEVMVAGAAAGQGHGLPGSGGGERGLPIPK